MLSTKKLPDGLWPVMLTPFRENMEVDIDGLRRLTQFYIDAGAAGLFANCLSSEMYQLTEVERLKVIETVVSQSGGRVPVVATGSFSDDADTATAFIKRVADAGTAAVVLITSIIVLPQENDAVLKSRLETIIGKTEGIPLGLYECPVPYKRLVTPEILQWLSGTGRFSYHKDTSCDPAAIDKKVKAMQGTGFTLYNADTPTAIDSLVSGAGGISPIAANFYPELYSFMLESFYRTGRTPALDQLHSLLTIMDRVVHAYYPMSAKVFLQKRGLKITSRTRLPANAMKSDDRIRFDALYGVFATLMKNHKINSVL
jgi:4-hydroxy-tetrahydrodipicolinate synthase